MKSAIFFFVLFLAISALAKEKSEKSENKLIEYSRLEFNGVLTEGVLLVKQTAFGKPAYTISYMIDGKPVHTRVLLKSYYDSVKKKISDVSPQLKNDTSKFHKDCRQSIRLVTRETPAAPRMTDICANSLDRKGKERIRESFLHAKNFAIGKAI